MAFGRFFNITIAVHSHWKEQIYQPHGMSSHSELSTIYENTTNRNHHERRHLTHGRQAVSHLRLAARLTHAVDGGEVLLVDEAAHHVTPLDHHLDKAFAHIGEALIECEFLNVILWCADWKLATEMRAVAR